MWNYKSGHCYKQASVFHQHRLGNIKVKIKLVTRRLSFTCRGTVALSYMNCHRKKFHKFPSRERNLSCLYVSVVKYLRWGEHRRKHYHRGFWCDIHHCTPVTHWKMIDFSVRLEILNLISHAVYLPEPKHYVTSCEIISPVAMKCLHYYCPSHSILIISQDPLRPRCIVMYRWLYWSNSLYSTFLHHAIFFQQTKHCSSWFQWYVHKAISKHCLHTDCGSIMFYKCSLHVNCRYLYEA